MSQLQAFLPIIVIGAIFYFLLIRPQRNRQRAAQALVSRMGPGDRVMTSSGLYGTVVDTDTESVVLEVSPGVELRFVKAAVQRILEPADGAIDAGEAARLDEDLDGDVDPDDRGGHDAPRSEPAAVASGSDTERR